jgi:predicted aspartyl protease
MRRSLTTLLLPLALVAAGVSSSFADEKCELLQYASLDMGTDRTGGVYVPAMVNGQKVNLLVDIGGFVSLLTQTTVQDLSLKQEALSARTEVSMPGTRIKRFVRADTVQLGKLNGAHITFLVMPDGRMPSEVGGTLGRDFMANYDVEFDFAKGKLNLFSPEHCNGQVAYWTHSPYARIPIKFDSTSPVWATVLLDGKPVDATIDTGFSRSIIGFEVARNLFDWHENTAGLAVVSKRSDGTPATYHFPFQTLSFSGVAVANPDILIVRPLGTGDVGSSEVPFAIGQDVLRQLHLYVAYRERAIYATSAEAN